MNALFKTYRTGILRTALILLCLLLPFVDGCSTYMTARRTSKKIARDAKDIVTFNEQLRKYIGLVRFENWSYYQRDDIEKVFQKQLSDILLSACPTLLLAKPEDDNYPDFLTELPPRVAGRVDNLNLALLGRQYGFDAIVTAAVMDISVYEEQRGIMWLRDSHSYMQIQFLVEIFDTETGAKLLNENYTHEIKIDESDFEFIRDRKPITIVQIPETIKYVASILGENACDAISGQPWKSFIISKDGGNIIISSGKNAGLEQGMTLNVYDTGNLIKGIEGERFFLPGAIKGEIRITYAHPDRAEAITIQDNGIQVGSPVKLK